MKSQDQIKFSLRQFTGSSTFTKFSPLFPNVVLTEGAEYLADECGAYWLMDMIASHILSVPKDETFTIAQLTVNPMNKAFFTLADDSPATKIYANQSISYTDFPLDEVKLYVIREGDEWVILLPSEY